MSAGKGSNTGGANALRPVYYLCGVEDYLVEKKVDDIKAAALTGPFASMNYQVFDGKGLSAQETVAAASTMPAFSDKRVILVRDAGAIKDEEALIKYVQDPSPYTCLIFTSGAKKPDLRSPLAKALTEKGFVTVFNHLQERELGEWVVKEVKALGKTISIGAARRLVEIAGTRLRDVKGEVEKAVLYAGDNSAIDIGDVEDACLDCREETVFGLSNAIGARDGAAAFRVYAKLSTEEPYGLIGVIARQLRVLLKTKALLRKGISPNAISSALNINPGFLSGYIKGSGNFTERELRTAIERLHRADVELKTGKVPPSIVIPQLIVELCARGAAA